MPREINGSFVDSLHNAAPPSTQETGILNGHLISTSGPGGIDNTGQIHLAFLQGASAQAVLQDSDQYLSLMTDYERAMRMEREGRVSEAEFRAYVNEQVVDWTASEKQHVIDTVKKIQDLFKERGYQFKFPNPVSMIRTNGKEDIRECGGYCRGNAIVIPSRSRYPSIGLITHELFHIQSQNDPELRHRLYQNLGFFPCNEIALPPELEALRLTNPDCPHLNVRISVTYQGEGVNVVPVLLYDPAKGRGFFQRLYIQLLKIEEKENGNWAYCEEGGKAIVFSASETEDFFEQTGDIAYHFHPEEILATRFKPMVINGELADHYCEEMHHTLTT